MDAYTITHALTCITGSLQDMKRDIIDLDRQIRALAANSSGQHASSSPVQAQQVAQPPVDVHALRSSIEVGLRTSIRSALHSDIQQGLKDDRQMTESALMVRYDAMVCKIVRDQVALAVAQLEVPNHQYSVAPPPLPLPVPLPVERRKRPTTVAARTGAAAGTGQAPIKTLLNVNAINEIRDLRDMDLICATEV